MQKMKCQVSAWFCSLCHAIFKFLTHNVTEGGIFCFLCGLGYMLKRPDYAAMAMILIMSDISFDLI